jgi:hypothetical protein
LTNPIIPAAVVPMTNADADETAGLPVSDGELDEGESNDDQDTVDRDVREAAKVNDKLTE